MSEDDIQKLMEGWRKHHEGVNEHFCTRISKGQDPQYLLLTCSDSRVEFSRIFGVKDPGKVFQVKNVGGVYSKDAKAAFTYALKHLKPEVIMIMHHSNCGGYAALDNEELEEEIVSHLYENRCNRAKIYVDSFLKEKGVKDEKLRSKLIIEEGVRIQAARMMGNLNLNRPDIAKQIHDHKICVIASVYDIEKDEVYLVPPSLEKSLDGERLVLNKCDPHELTKLTGEVHTYQPEG